jgi:N-acyl-L-homoserine lactone synthetase
MAAVVFKEADTDSEIQQVHRLNHLTFAEELGQHPATPEGFLVDRFHARNRYMVAVENGKVVGMISVHDQPPFSIQKRMPGGLDPLERFARPCEVRLLAIERGARRGMILAGLFWRVYDYAKKSLHSHMLISGVQERLAMYKALGFEELGPAQAEGASSFVPMALDLRRESARLRKRASLYSSWWQRRVASAPISLLPGPVAISPEVRAAFQQTVLSHREESFLQTHTRVRAHLGQLSAGMNAVIVTGSGTFANDMVAAALRAAFGEVRGLVLANGEFGDRLVAQARRAGLRFESLIWQWGSAWEFGAIEKRLRGGAAWVWGVHLETSTSELNDLRHLSDLCKQNGARLAADCVSSLGAVAIDDLDLMFASGVSGKAIGAYPGLAFVFAKSGAGRESVL